MEREAFFSGYCRQIDGSRTVALEADGNQLMGVDCRYETCPHAPNCTIGQRIWEFLEEKQKV